MNNQQTVRYLLPDEQICECQTEDLLHFIQMLQAVDSLSIRGVRYRVLDTELVLDTTLWLMVTLEEGRRQPEHSQVKELSEAYQVPSAFTGGLQLTIVH